MPVSMLIGMFGVMMRLFHHMHMAWYGAINAFLCFMAYLVALGIEKSSVIVGSFFSVAQRLIAKLKELLFPVKFGGIACIFSRSTPCFIHHLEQAAYGGWAPGCILRQGTMILCQNFERVSTSHHIFFRNPIIYQILKQLPHY